MSNRTFVIGDIHGGGAELSRLLAKLPAATEQDTVVFLGDYIDRGPESRQVIECLQVYRLHFPGKMITLRGNHEDAWLECLQSPNPGFLLPEQNGCRELLRSFLPDHVLDPEEELRLLLEPQSWFPAETRDWMLSLPLWYEDEHAIYVHAGLDGEGDDWKHPRDSRAKCLLWMREPDFFLQYRGKRLVFGHTTTSCLPSTAHLLDADNAEARQEGKSSPSEVWRRGDLIGLDTGCGKGGHLSALELPSGQVWDSRE